MNQHLQNILNTIQQDKNLSEEEKNAIIKSLKDADKEFEITNFKLDRTEKVKRTTAILLEETIEELEQKRKAVEAQNRELEIETALERVRSVAMSMNTADDLLSICETMFHELNKLGFVDLRNTMIDIHYDDKKHLLNYDYAENTGRTITTYIYNLRPEIDNLIEQAKQSKGVFTEWVYSGETLNDWRAFRKQHGESDDSRLDNVDALYYYFYSLGSGDIGISTFTAVTKEQLSMLKRFGNVFDLAYRRYIDISNAEAQAKEAKIEASLERMRAAAMSMQKSDEIIHVSESMYKELTALGFTNIRNAQIAIQNETKQAYTVFEFSDYAAGKGEAAYNSSHITQELYNELGKTKDAFYQKEFSGKEFEEWRKWRKSLPVSTDKRIDSAESVCFYLYSFGTGHLGISTFNPISEEQIEILKRFKKVFELSYQRYTDVAKAEAQSKEAKIELALERVRARTMAMQKSDELGETAWVLFQQFEELGEDPEQIGIGIMNEEEEVLELWSTINGKMRDRVVRVPLHEPILISKLYKAWKEDKKSLIVDLSGKDLEDYNNFRNSLAEIKIDISRTKNRRIVSAAYFSKGHISLATTEPRPPETMQLLERFANVFDLTYTRFLDLQKAEAQAREAKIEAALERTRTQSMIMQHSNELDDTLRVFHEQVLLLNIPSAFSFLWLPDEDHDRHIFWASWKEEKNGSPDFKSKAINYPLDRTEPATARCLIDWKGTEPIVSYHVPPAGVANYFAAWQELIDGVEQLKPEYFSGGLYYVEAFMKYGCFGVIVTNDLTIDEKKILGRFAIEFERTYRRFLDLQKAEAQAREAQIEAALEKVRSRSLAMHQSSELEEVIMVVSEQLLQLQFRFHNVSFSSTNEQQETTFWLATPGRPHPYLILLPYIDTTMLNRVFEAREKGVEFLADIITEEQNQEWLQHLVYKSRHSFSEEDKKYLLTLKGLARSTVLTKHIILAIINYAIVPYTEEQNAILKRFGNVFEQAYTRFLDLQKAESQARESKIEASLERVRSKAMSMQKSEDLAAAITIVFEELDKLDLGMLRCGIGILNKKKRTADVWTTTIADDNTVVQVAGDESMDIHPLLSGAFNAWLNKEDHSYTLKGEDLNNYYKAVAGANFKLPDSQSLVSKTEGVEQYYFNAVFSAGGLFAFRETPFPEEAKIILRRFADVFTLTYTRFSDLKQAEAQAKEARIEVALERVRSRTLAMQRSDELAETAAVLFRQLILLGIQPNRLYIAVVKDDSGSTEFWITDEDGSKVSSAFETNLNDNPTFRKMFAGWKAEKKSLIIDMQGEELQEYFKYLTSIHVPFKGGLTQKRRIQDIAYFSKGFIGMASPDEQPAETLQLLERFAYTFNLTFTRFNDLKLAEAHAVQAEEDLIKLQTEKKRAEDALTELRSTQTQLIQSEKMASLGELTAGIAHEIQNPLNFVNNFSEVSVELIEELKSEKAKPKSERDDQLEEELLNDITQNLEKINHHGKRADAIVKGMLQHSRTTGTTREPSDINKLADEYLRLAYHGLRAKDKSFNATLKTDFDETIGKINIIPQDIGRVILNLITNAFYAVDEKKKQSSNDYQPTVTVSTNRSPLLRRGVGGEVQITVSDNGNGIPSSIKDKIFQPFFTTKPTGQGTGLGLSLAYDIVKAHGGEIKVETQETQGTTFIIQLPHNP